MSQVSSHINLIILISSPFLQIPLIFLILPNFPIALLPTLSKVFERIVHSHLYDFSSGIICSLLFNLVFYKYVWLYLISLPKYLWPSMGLDLLVAFSVLYQRLRSCKHDLLLAESKRLGVEDVKLDRFCSYLTNWY